MPISETASFADDKGLARPLRLVRGEQGGGEGAALAVGADVFDEGFKGFGEASGVGAEAGSFAG
ncbi:hypothetical protein GCM10007973_24840 [Polymorphobacter multimanifer]|uniref:Uncharacterized protein n=1 Tax=Polymorphobacter multimanifer TaxID=1070431 RepID=A0A841L890_9SPHN|nr:hypothetical protein [Polymorphobacter multimanifer]MBB6228847.1 hypothetical protein [Polymorphobacter multimanifer]GGI87405.1 hypothetical protein GCM10007973_24840 [Polymorphobacter multimanifer]